MDKKICPICGHDAMHVFSTVLGAKAEDTPNELTIVCDACNAYVCGREPFSLFESFGPMGEHDEITVKIAEDGCSFVDHVDYSMSRAGLVRKWRSWWEREGWINTVSRLEKLSDV